MNQVTPQPSAPSEPPASREVERSLRAAVHDGSAHAFMLGSGETYLSALGVFLKGSPLQIGMLAAIPQIFGSIWQAIGVWVMERTKSRRRVIVTAASLQALVWFPIAALPLFVAAPWPAMPLLIALVMAYHALTGFGNPIWSSLIGDIVPSKQRGSYFGFRSKRCGLATFVGLLLAGAILHLAEQGGSSDAVAAGFAAVFCMAGLARLLSAHWLRRYMDVSYAVTAEQRFSFWGFLARLRHSNFAKFVFFVSTINMATFIAGPYFAVYLLRDLQVTYLQYMIITAASFAAQYATLQHWGNLSDRFGNKKILNVCAFGVAVNPFFWFVSGNWIYIVAVQLYSGFVWAGFNLAAANFMFDAVSPPKRARCAAYQALVNGTCVFLGTMLGGWLATHEPVPLPALAWLPEPSSPILFVFLLSGILRIAAAAYFVPRVREVREVERIRHRELVFRVVNVRALAGFSFGMLGERYSRALRLLPKKKEEADR